MSVKLKNFSNKNFDKGSGFLIQLLWIMCSAIIVRNSWFIFMSPKIILLRMFGAKIGKGLVIKPSVNIKFPWKLRVGSNVWIGENVWIDNLDYVTIGNNVCISQGAFILTGNHDYTSSSFDYKNAPITLEDGVWIGAKSVVCPGSICRSHSILTVGSVVTKNMNAYKIYQGNPAKQVRERTFSK